MHIRTFNTTDIPEDVKIQVREFDTENILDWIPDPYNIEIAVIYDDRQDIMALGIVRAITEFKMVINSENSPRERVRATKLLMSHALDGPCNEHLIVATKGGETFQKFLKKYFNFEEVEGVPLKLEV